MPALGDRVPSHCGPRRRVNVEALADAETGLAETGEAVSGRFHALFRLAAIFQLFTSSAWRLGTACSGRFLANLVKVTIPLSHLATNLPTRYSRISIIACWMLGSRAPCATQFPKGVRYAGRHHR